MDDLRRKSVDEQVGGKGESMKGKVKEGLGKISGERDVESEETDQAERKARERAGKTDRAVSDATERIKDRLRGYEN